MKPAYAASFAAALLCHALLLFGFKVNTPARPLAAADEPSVVDVSLVAPPPVPPPVEPPPPPTPIPSPEPHAPEMPAAPPVPVPAPRKEMPVPAPQQKPPQKTAAAPATPRKAVATGNGPITASARYRSNPRPEYPDEARRLHQEGVALLSVQVSAEGLPVKVSLERSSGFALLDQAAIQAVKRWTFEPARVGPLPVASRVDVPVRFSLSL